MKVLVPVAVLLLVVASTVAQGQPVHERQLLTLGWNHYLSSFVNTLVSAYTKAAVEGRAAAVRGFMAQQGLLPGNGTQALMRQMLPQLLGQLTNKQAGAPTGASPVQVVQLPNSMPSSGINVKTKTPVAVDSPVRVRTPTDEILIGGRGNGRNLMEHSRDAFALHERLYKAYVTPERLAQWHAFHVEVELFPELARHVSGD